MGLFRASGVFTALVILVSARTAHAGYIYAENPWAKDGRYLPELTESAHDILRRNGIQTDGSYGKPELNALARGIAQVERLNGGPMPAAWRIGYQWVDQKGAWNQGLTRAGYVTIKKQSYGSTNIAAMMHEQGHAIANANGGKILNAYLKAAKPCGITPYAKSKRSEEFGEVFSAFLVNPDDLKRQCPTAFSALVSAFQNGGAYQESSVTYAASRAILHKMNAQGGGDSQGAMAGR